jgi:hypothetical protein
MRIRLKFLNKWKNDLNDFLFKLGDGINHEPRVDFYQMSKWILKVNETIS